MVEDSGSDEADETPREAVAAPPHNRSPSVEDTLAADSDAVDALRRTPAASVEHRAGDTSSADANGVDPLDRTGVAPPRHGAASIEDTPAAQTDEADAPLPAVSRTAMVADTLAGTADDAIGSRDTIAGAKHASAPGTDHAHATRMFERGDPIGRYVVLSKLGVGGMGVVYAAYDPELDRKVAIKLMLPGHRNDAQVSEGRTRLLREAQALARLNHPNVVAVHDVGTLDASVWIAMEFVEGQTINDWAAAKPRSWLDALAVMRQAGLGLQAAHEANLLHRDFKPDNVMVGADGRVRVMDFGLARGDGPREGVPVELPGAPSSAATSSSSLDAEVTAGNALLGTPAYMSPEQWRRTVIDTRSDQFSFCVTLWELLYAERPFEGDSVANLMCSVLEDRRRPPAAGRNVPTWLRKVCERGLAAAPSQRHPQTWRRCSPRCARPEFADVCGQEPLASPPWGLGERLCSLATSSSTPRKSPPARRPVNVSARSGATRPVLGWSRPSPPWTRGMRRRPPSVSAPGSTTMRPSGATLRPTRA